jgi:hypothetical protein
MEESMNKLRKRITRASVLTGVLLMAGVAFAAWTASGTGTGYAKAVTAQALSTLDVSAQTSADLYPGGDGDVKLKISNPNAYPIEITDVSGEGAITTASDDAACDASTGVSFEDQSYSNGSGLDVPANGSATFTLSDAVSMSNASANACQGEVFEIPVSLSGQSDA